MVLISSMTMLFSSFTPKIPKSGISGPELRFFFFFGEILQIDPFEAADFKYDNSFSKTLAKKYRNKAFWVNNIHIRHFLSHI